MENTRFQTGLEQLSKIDGEAGQKVIESLNDICPDLAKFTIEYPFGDIYTREGLDLKSREIATVSALTVIIQMSVYAGFPAALNGMFAFKEVLSERQV
ncbi:TPA: carboxymuconolactone decarboxylase family protein [Vibrio parahaemolyticus]